MEMKRSLHLNIGIMQNFASFVNNARRELKYHKY